MRALFFCLLVVLIWATALADRQSDCDKEIVKLQPCLDYVGGKSEKPNATCCSNLTYLYENKAICLCMLIASSGGLSATPGINITYATLLPVQCSIYPNVSRCTDLLASGSSSRFSGLWPFNVPGYAYRIFYVVVMPVVLAMANSFL